MLGEKEAPNAVPFHSNAKKAFLISNLGVAIIGLFIILLIPIVVFVVVASAGFGEGMAAFALPFAALLLVLVIAVLAFLWWYSGAFFKNFFFELRKDYLFSRKGVFKASYTTIPYERIQDIHLTQSIYDNLFGLWRVSIYTATATGRGSEDIPGLSKENAEAMKSELFKRIKRVREIVD